ncbi:MAG: IPT/TIG domain-containing protein [Ferruginibacter sp.]
MKQMKKTMMAMAGGLLFLTVAIISCKKDDNSPGVAAPTITAFTPESGTTGTTVTITGTNFTGTTAVSFGGTAAASFALVSTSSITAVVGAGASGDVSVTTPGGTAIKSGFTFTAPLTPVDGYSSSNEVESADLIAYWPFDGNLTENLHTSAPVLTGGTQTFVTGRIGQAAHLAAGWMTYGPDATEASTDNTSFGSNDALQNGFTVTAWIHVDATDLLSNVFQLSTPNIPNWPILGLGYRKHAADNSFDMDFGIGNVDGTGPHISYAGLFQEPSFLDSLDWAFIAVTYDATTKSANYYANGILRATKDLSSVFPDPAASLLMIAPNYATIGSFEGQNHTPGSTNTYPGFMGDGITGDIDDIRFFKKTLAEQKLTDLYILGNQGR